MSMRLPHWIQAGNYAAKQLVRSNPLLKWSHQGRWRSALRLLRKQSDSGKSLLDFGCGDGTLAGILESHQIRFGRYTGFDLSSEQIIRNQARSQIRDPLSTMRLEWVSDWNEIQLTGNRFDVVTCFEVFEHLLQSEWGPTLGRLLDCVRPDGTVVVSVPIEIGPSLVGKYLVRTWLSVMKAGDYTTREILSWKDWVRLVFAGPNTQIQRPIYEGRFHGHLGFNWRTFESVLSERFEIKKRVFSPWPAPSGWGASQVFWLLSPLKSR